MTRAADNALPRAVHRMSVLYANGWGVPEDTTKAYEYCLRAAELEDPDAQCDMGLYYARGEMVEQNYAEAVNGSVFLLCKEIWKHNTIWALRML
jgi:TPR repeat protein